MSRFPQARFLLSVASVPQFPPDCGAEVAFAGRSNAGKSSAINALTGRHGLAHTSRLPGRTRLLNYFELAPGQRIVDLPGYGYAEVPAEERRRWVPLLEGLRARESLAGLMLVIDARRGVRDEDLELVSWADPARRPVQVLLSKVDKLNQAEKAAALRSARAALSTETGVQLLSAQSGEGVEAAQKVLIAMLRGAGGTAKKKPRWREPPGPD
jgi:GTP-binding protein